ncbi:MAG: DUF3160 domain-containing protein [bacterium]
MIPFTLINYEGSLYHPFDLSFNNLPPQDLFFPFTLYPYGVLLPESLRFYNQYDFYHYTLFFPPLKYTSFEFPHWYSWFLPFTQGYRNDFESQEVIIAEDIKDDIEEFMENYLMALDEAKNLTCRDLIQKFPEDEYVTDLGYTVSETNFYDLVKSQMGLTQAEEEKINKNGFVVSNRNSYLSFGEAYLDFYKKDLPLFISTDSILQALHRSYDEILSELEKEVLMNRLELILSRAQAVLPQIVANPTGMLADTYHDINVFYTVARKLLGRYNSPLPYLEDELVQSILNSVNALAFKNFNIFGETRNIDFSQFKPRGHYTKSEEFKRYFRAMMWLGRIDLRVEYPRQLLGSYLIWRSVEEAGVRHAWDDMDKMFELMVGEPDAMNLRTFTMLMGDAGVQGLEDLLNPQMQGKILETIEEKGYGEQRICSHYLACDPFKPEVTQMPKSFTFMGQRFTVDSHVFSNVVFDRIVVNGVKIRRMMPDPLDVMFVIGNNRALYHMEDELTKWQYQGNLFILRYLLDQYTGEFWESNMYNGWLDALRSLSAPFEGEGYPKSMRTPAYRDKLLYTQLASWAELRHDNILYVKQSYTGGIICEYPDGYVESIPEFYRKLKNFANKARDILNSIYIPNDLKQSYISYYETFANTMNTLEILAKKQIDGQPRTKEETQFIKDTIDKKTYPGVCGGPPITFYGGWYPKLFYKDPEFCVEPDFIVADVHTNPNGPPYGNYDVLHVGVGRINVIYFTAETCAGPTLYVGPVFSYYEKTETEMKRLNDEEWSMLVHQDSLNPPLWAYTFMDSMSMATNHAPIIIAGPTQPVVIKAGEEFILHAPEFAVEDPDGDEIYASCNIGSCGRAPDGSFMWKFQSNVPGSYQVEIIFSDQKGGTDMIEFLVNVEP